jgi:acetyl/propionyl-CoA carboxylase alpha subunit
VGEDWKREKTDWRSVGAGTVEFIMDAETGEYFFMEM